MKRLPTYSAVLALFLLAPPALRAQQGGSVTAELSVERPRVYQFESFVVTLTIDASNVRLSKSLELVSLPDKDRLELSEFQELPVERKLEGDNIREIRRYRCDGLCRKAGALSMAPTLRASVIVQQRTFFGRQWIESPIETPVKPLPLDVLPLPEAGRPTSFSGAVGRLTFSAVPSATDVAAGDLIRLAMAIRGRGYYETLVPPSYSAVPGFKVYDLRPQAGGPDERLYEQILIPQSTNAVAIPPLSFSYFDPAAGAFKTVTQGPFPLVFHPPRRTVDDVQYRPLAGTAAGGKTAVSPGTAKDALAGLKEVRWADAATAKAYTAAVQAYADGYYPAAADGFESLIRSAPASLPLRFNLANARFLAGQIGQAVLNYRRVWYQAPRDAAVRSNLAVALQSAHAQSDALTYAPRLRIGEARALASLAALAALALAGVAVARSRARPAAVAALVLAAAGCAAALASAREMADHMASEAVVVRRETARLAPAASALPSFECQEGALLRVVESSGTWLKIARGDDRGWLPASAVCRTASRP